MLARSIATRWAFPLCRRTIARKNARSCEWRAERSLGLTGALKKSVTQPTNGLRSLSVKANEEEKKKEVLTHSVWDDAFNIPNALTMARIVATPGICWLITEEKYDLAIASFWIAGFFDWLDGYLARKWDQKTIFGSFLDPLADKVFVAGTMLTLTYEGLIPLALGGIIIGRDLVLVGGSFYIRSLTRPKGARFFEMGDSAGVVAVQASEISRWNTLFQFGLIWFTMTHHAWGVPPEYIMPAIWIISGGSTVASGMDYLNRGNWRNIFVKKESRT